MKSLVIITIFSISLILANPVSNEDEEEETEEQVSVKNIEESEIEHKHPYGGPINLMRFDENENVIIDEEALERTFNHPLVKDRYIVAVSIIGAFRKGKSFLMDYALRFMYANYKSVAYQDNPLENKRNWIGDPDEPLQGFSWRGGSSRDTTGVVLWSDVFLYEQKDPKTKKMEQFAIILMDTQGLFDTKTSPTDNSRIFALGTLISSVQIFNLNDVIQENQLEYLHMATDFAKYAMRENKKKNSRAKNYKPFQTLIFLMRDWQNIEDFNYGQGGGAEYLAQVLNIEPKQPQTLQDVRKYIKESFDQRLCFLLPHPGFQAVNNKDYDGRYSELSEDFQTHLKDFLNFLLQPKNLKKKKVLNTEVKGADYLEYMKIYFEAFQSDEIPKIDTLHGITVNKQYDIILTQAFEIYKNLTQKILVDHKTNEQWKLENVIEQEMNEMHQEAQQEAVKMFKDKKKLGTKKDEDKFEGQLKNQIQKHFDELKSKHLDKYRNLKKVEEESEQKLLEVKKQAEEQLIREQTLAEEERIRLEELHKNKTAILVSTIDNLKNKSEQEINLIKEQFSKLIQDAEEQKKILRDQLEKEQLAIQQKEQESQNKFKLDLQKLQEEIQRKEEAAKKVISDKQSERLEAIKLQAEERKREYEFRMQMEKDKAALLAEQRKEEQRILAEERRIREEAIREEKRERKEAEERRLEAERAFQMKMAEAKIQADKEAREAKAEKERIHQETMRAMTTPAPIPEKGFNLWKCLNSIFTNC